MRDNIHHNYLRTLRKRSGLTEVQVAHLLGCQSWSKVSRHELGITRPALADLAAYELIYDQPMRTLFAPAFCLARINLRHWTAAMIVQEKAGMNRKAVLDTLADILRRCEG